MMNSKTKVGEPKGCSWCGWYADTSTLLSCHIPTYRNRRPSLPDISHPPSFSGTRGMTKRECHFNPKRTCYPLDIPMYTVWYPPPAPGALNVGSGSWSIGGIRFRGKCHSSPPDIHISGPCLVPAICTRGPQRGFWFLCGISLRGSLTKGGPHVEEVVHLSTTGCSLTVLLKRKEFFWAATMWSGCKEQFTCWSICEGGHEVDRNVGTLLSRLYQGTVPCACNSLGSLFLLCVILSALC
jgi:hypothetical protein